ncbi:hypothetical protein K438DRAFT_2122310 [Mycena galopus ATCC 62051]|nr:hypothetical protein K438DRAFT_2122310 [Mycena galopus ATCC 62051]
MPRQPTVNEIRLNGIKTCLTLALPLLNELHDAFGPPFVQSIVNTIQTLVNSIQAVKHNKSDCVQLMENIHGFLYAIVDLHMNSEPVGSLPPLMLDNIGKFVELELFTRYIHLLEHNSRATRTGASSRGLRGMVYSFFVNSGLTGSTQIQTQPQVLNGIRDFKKLADLRHKELMELVENLSDTNTVSDRSSPKIFHGREHEMDHILKLLTQQSPRIAILGGGGMGKTSLARAVLHHPDISSKFEHQFFVSAEAATTSVELAALIGLHLGLNPGKDLTKPVIHYFSKKEPSLLILDNLETIWEPIQSRGVVEEFLSLLTGIEHLALMITMRGNGPLLQFTDNMPLAVDLIAHLTDYEGFSNVLSRWTTEKTSLLSVGFDRQSSVEASITLSLSSPGITSDSKALLSLLSILPNGLSEEELVQSNLGIPNIFSCKAVLQATSLTYQDSNQRLMVLVPIREYIQQILPPSLSCIQLICQHLYVLLELSMKYNGEQMKPVINQITLNLANLQELLHRGLHLQSPTFADAIHWSVSEDAIAQVLLYLDNTKDPVLGRFHLSHHKGDIQQGIQFLHKALEMSELCGNRKGQVTVLLELGEAKLASGNYPAGYAYASMAERLTKLSANFYQAAQAHQLAATCLRSLGTYQESVRQLYMATEILHICGLSGGQLAYQISVSQGEIHRLKSEYKEARNIYCQIVETASVEQNSLSYAVALLNIAHIDTVIGGADEIIYHNLKTAEGILGRSNVHDIIYCDFVQATIKHRGEKFDSAKVIFRECLSLSWGHVSEGVSLCLEQLANITAWPASKRDHKWAIIYLGFACKSKEKLALHNSLLFLGDVFIAKNDEGTAANLYQAALEGFTRMDVHQSRAQCMLRLGDLANKHGFISEAITLWAAARPLFERSLQTKDVTHINSRLAALENADQKAVIKPDTLHPPLQLVEEESSENKGEDSVGGEAEECVVPVS